MTGYLEQIPDYTDRQVVAALDELSLWAARFGIILLDNLPYPSGKNILDLGCGAGFPLLELAKQLGSSFNLTGVDLWEEALERAEQKRLVYGLENVRLVKCDGAKLPFPNNSFALVVSNLGLNNFENPLQVVKECARVLEPGGMLALTTNLTGHMHEFYELFREILVELKLEKYLSALAEQETHRGTVETLQVLLESDGFTVNRKVTGEFKMRFYEGSAFLRHFFVRLGFLPGWKGVLPEPEQPIVFAALEEKLNRLAHVNGELKLTIPTLYLEARVTK
jgi:ubiquinone/menaquinone biosynthesis C-methylase UbiE